MRALKLAVIAALLVLPIGKSYASVLGNLLSFDGVEDIVNDDSVGIFVERSGTIGDGILETGDLIQGMINFGPVDTNAIPAGSSVIGAYSFEVTGSTTTPLGGGGSITNVTFGAASGADSVFSILSAAGVDLNGLDFTDVGLAVLDSDSAAPSGRADFAGPPFGFTGASGISGSDFTAVMTLEVVEHIVTDTVVIPSVLEFVTFTGTYDVVDDAFGPSVVYLDTANAITGSVGDVVIDTPGTISPSDTTTSPNGWVFNDDGDYRLNAVPEPMSVLVWGGLACAATIVNARRRKA